MPVRDDCPGDAGTTCPSCENEMDGSNILWLCCSEPRVKAVAPASVLRSGVTCDGSYDWELSCSPTPRAAPIGGFAFPPFGLVPCGWIGGFASFGPAPCF